MTNMEPQVTIEKRAPGEWIVRAECVLDRESRVGTVIIRSQAVPDQCSYVALVKSRAWLALGQAALDTGHADSAITCAQNGLEAMGSDYASSTILDDTETHLYLAEEHLQEGHSMEAAAIMLQILDTRISWYIKFHKEIIVE